MTGAVYEVGDKVTVRATPEDPIVIELGPHVEVVEVVSEPDGHGYMVAHGGSRRREGSYGPYPGDKLIRGWQ
jgi:hypothetical protein